MSWPGVPVNGPTTSGTWASLTNPSLGGTSPNAVGVQVRNGTGWVVQVSGADGIIQIDPFTAATVPLAGSPLQLGLDATLQAYPAAPQGYVTSEWLGAGETPTQPDGAITAAAVAASISGAVTLAAGSTVDLAAGATVGIAGTATVDASGSTIDLAAGTTIDLAAGTTVTADLAAGASVDIGNTPAVTISGTPTVDASGSTIDLAAGTTVTADLAAGSQIIVESGTITEVTSVAGIGGNVSIVNGSSTFEARTIPIAADVLDGSGSGGNTVAANGTWTGGVTNTLPADQLGVLAVCVTPSAGTWSGTCSCNVPGAIPAGPTTVSGQAAALFLFYFLPSQSESPEVTVTNTNDQAGNVTVGLLTFGETSSGAFSNIGLVGAFSGSCTIGKSSLTSSLTAANASLIVAAAADTGSFIPSSASPGAIYQAELTGNANLVMWYTFNYPAQQISATFGGATAAPANTNGLLVAVPQ